MISLIKLNIVARIIYGHVRSWNGLAEIILQKEFILFPTSKQKLL